MKIYTLKFKAKSLSLICIVVLITFCYCSNTNSPEINHRTTLKFNLNPSVNSTDSILDNIDLCNPERDYFYLVYNKDSNEYVLQYYDRMNHKIISQSKSTFNKSTKINIYNLDPIIPHEEYGEITQVSYCLNQSFLISTDSGISVFDYKKGVFNSKKHSDIFDFAFYHVPLNNYSPLPLLKENKTIISFGGNSDAPQKKHHLDFEMFALFDLNSLKADVLKFTFPENHIKENDILSPDFFTFSNYQDKPYVRYRQDSILHNISTTRKNTITLKGPSDSARSNINSILSTNNFLFKSISYGGEFLKQSSAGHWSSLIPIYKGKNYCVLSFLPVKIEKAGSNRIQSEFKPYIDIYDRLLNHMRRVELPFITTSQIFYIGNDEFIFPGKITDGRIIRSTESEKYFEVFKVQLN